MAAAGWAKLPAAIRTEVGARLASTGALRSLDTAVRLLAQQGTIAQLNMVSHGIVCCSNEVVVSCQLSGDLVAQRLVSQCALPFRLPITPTIAAVAGHRLGRRLLGNTHQSLICRDTPCTAAEKGGTSRKDLAWHQQYECAASMWLGMCVIPLNVKPYPRYSKTDQRVNRARLLAPGIGWHTTGAARQ